MTIMHRRNSVALILLGLLLFACSTNDQRTLTTDSSMTINYEINGERFLIHPPEKYNYLEFEKRRSCCFGSGFKWRKMNDSISTVAIYFRPDKDRLSFKQQIEKELMHSPSINFLTEDSSVFRTEWIGQWGDTIYHNQVTYYSGARATWTVSIWCRECDELDKQFVERVDEE